MSIARVIQTAAALVILFAASGVAYSFREFVKIKIGPAFILEASFFIWAMLAILSSKRAFFKSLLSLKLPILFFLWGMFLFSLDLTLSKDLLFTMPPITTWNRVIRHLQLFFYPVLWMWVGYWFSLRDQKWIKLISYAILALAGIANNKSTGPLLAIPFIFFLNEAFENRKNFFVFLGNAVIALSLGFLTFYPFWQMWLQSMQRTQLMLLLCLLILPTLLIAKKKPLRYFQLTGTALLIFISGLLTGTLLSSPEKKETNIAASLKQQFYSSMQHGDDRVATEQNQPSPAPQSQFEFRFRRFQWKTAINDWLQSPILGIGFIPEVPSYFQENLKNDGTYAKNPEADSLGANPVAGPHNSYLSVLARMGVIGISILLALGIVWLKKAWILIEKKEVSIATLVCLFIPINGALHAFFNVTLESPQNCMLIWLFAGISTGLADQLKLGSLHKSSEGLS